VQATRFWASAGDIIRDMGALFEHVGFSFSDHEVGGFGSVHLYVATKTSAQPCKRINIDGG
jgi:hypothetical protein